MTSKVTVLIDTASHYSILAILRDGAVVRLQIVDEPKTLLREIGLFSLGVRSEVSLMEEVEVEIALCTGPSGFSGGRIGVATGRSLAVGWGIDLMIFDHLELLSHVASTSFSCDVVVEDAKGGEVHIFDVANGASLSITVNFHEALSFINPNRKALLVGACPKDFDLEQLAQVDRVEVSDLAISRQLGSFIEAIRGRERVPPDKVHVRYGRDYVAIANFEKLR